MKYLNLLKSINYSLMIPIVFLMLSGLFTMSSFGVNDTYFLKQSVWIIVAVTIFISSSYLDFRFLKDTRFVVFIYAILMSLLLLVFILGKVTNGAQSWLYLGGFSFQPADLMKLGLIIVLAKYFSRRHIEVGNVRHVLLSGFYALLPFLLVVLQPDLGSAMVLFFIWFFMILFSGISKKHLFFVIFSGVIIFLISWNFVFKPYQKARIVNFINPLHDIRGTGYNVYQSVIAVGSGGLLGKGVGYGTQSRLNFLPEYRTDFIFAAYAEEWGFVGAVLMLLFFAIIFYRLIFFSLVSYSTFEALFTYGVIIWIATHVVINIGMNIGIMPVTGIPLPFVSYGGSHLVSEALALGMCVAMNRYARSGHKYQMKNEFLGLE